MTMHNAMQCIWHEVTLPVSTCQHRRWGGWVCGFRTNMAPYINMAAVGMCCSCCLCCGLWATLGRLTACNRFVTWRLLWSHRSCTTTVVVASLPWSNRSRNLSMTRDLRSHWDWLDQELGEHDLVSREGGTGFRGWTNMVCFFSLWPRRFFFSPAWSSKYLFHFYFGIFSTISWRQLFILTPCNYNNYSFYHLLALNSLFQKYPPSLIKWRPA